MELPIELRNIIDSKLNYIDIKQIQKDAENISLKYRNESGRCKKIVTKEMEALAYSAVRMPATYGAIFMALKQTFEIYDKKNINSLLDVGAGTGAGTWAGFQFLEFEKAICLEREEVMLKLGKSLMQDSEENKVKNVEWKKFDFLQDNIEEKADMVICSYVLNELDENSRKIALEKLWNATNKLLIIIEPGTPVGFEEIKHIRKFIKNKNGNIIAPCPSVDECPILDNDWCHSICRVSRARIHKIIKNGDVPYEDEKFSYLAISKEYFDKKDFKRVLRHPKIESGKISLKICSNQGIEEIIVTKKNKDFFKLARKFKCGDKYEY